MYQESNTSIHENPRIKALMDKHSELSQKVNDAQKNVSSPDFYINQLKKQKLLIKEKIAAMPVPALIVLAPAVAIDTAAAGAAHAEPTMPA